MIDSKETSLDPTFLSLIESNDKLDPATEHFHLVDPKLGKKYCRAYRVGIEKMLIFGNPLIMSTRSGFWENTISNDTFNSVDEPHIATHISVMGSWKAFLSHWCYLNRFPFYDLEESKSIRFVLDIFMWKHYFDSYEYNEDYEDFGNEIPKAVMDWKSINSHKIGLLTEISNMAMQMAKISIDSINWRKWASDLMIKIGTKLTLETEDEIARGKEVD